MAKPPERRIAIIGGAGLSGRLLAVNLLRLASSPIAIRAIDRGDARCMGPAYSDESDHLLLNVPANRMGALAEDERHFLEWARSSGVRAGEHDFLPRKLFRQYVLDLLHRAQQTRAPGVDYRHVRAEVTDIERTRDGVTIRTADGTSRVADLAVLSLGNFLPRDPPLRNRAAFESPRYVRNPWNTAFLDALARDDTVFLIGTGQTTVDLAVSLERRGHRGRIVAISRRGYLPLAHRSFEAYPSFYSEIREARRMREIFQTVRAHFDRAEAIGLDARSVIDSLRPDTQTLWLDLPVDEKRRFLRHLVRFWEITRSRLPPQSRAAIDAMRAAGQLEVVAGRIRELTDAGAALEVRYTPRWGTGDKAVRAALVVNCMGPEANYERIDHPLVASLRQQGLIRPSPTGFGIDALPNGAIVGRDGAASDVLYALGPMMKGVLWESVAVPDIRVQAERLARLLLGSSAKAMSAPA